MQARYYTSSQGRFTSVDPLLESAKRINPQTWNRYTYALNNPLRYTDPDGEDPDDVFKRTTTTTTKVTVEEHDRKGIVVQQAEITITEVKTEYVNDKGEVIPYGATVQTSAQAVNTGLAGTRDYSDDQLRTMERVATNIVEVSREKGFDAPTALGIAAYETHMGTLANNLGVSWRNSDINPMSLSGGAAKGKTLRENIAGSIDLFNSKNGNTLNEKLQYYRGSKVSEENVTYARDAEQRINKIRASRQTHTATSSLNQSPFRLSFPTRPQ